MDTTQQNLKNNEEAPASWCVLPWSHISIKGDGTYRICCHSNSSHNQGILRDKDQKNFHIRQANWENVMNSDTMKTVRRNMLKGKWPDECIRCKREHESGMSSRNLYERLVLAEIIEPDKYPSYLKTTKLTQPDGSISSEDFPISYLDIRFGNLCNLKCVMCGPTDSNKWYEDYQALWGYNYFHDHKDVIRLVPDTNGKLKTEKNIFNWSDDPHLWLQIEKNLSNFRKIYIAGGEPLLIKSHYDFLQKCVDKGVAEKLIIDYNSNITHIPDKAWELWKHFKSIDIGVSLDGYGAVNDFIRYPSQWNQIEKNLEKFSKAEGIFNLRITMSVSVLNIWHLPQFIDYIIKKNHNRINSLRSATPFITPHPVHKPTHLNINILENSFKEKILEYFNDYKKRNFNLERNSFNGKGNLYYNWKRKIKKTHKILDTYIDYMNKIRYSKEELVNERSKFIYFMDRLDKLRKTKWKEVLPELYENTLEWRNPPKGG